MTASKYIVGSKLYELWREYLSECMIEMEDEIYTVEQNRKQVIKGTYGTTDKKKDLKRYLRRFESENEQWIAEKTRRNKYQEYISDITRRVVAGESVDYTEHWQRMEGEFKDFA